MRTIIARRIQLAAIRRTRPAGAHAPVEPEPVITEQTTARFVEARADDVEAEHEGHGALLYAIDEIVAEVTGETWPRVLVAAYAAGRLEHMASQGPRVAAYLLLAVAAENSGDQAAAAEWVLRAVEAGAQER